MRRAVETNRQGAMRATLAGILVLGWAAAACGQGLEPPDGSGGLLSNAPLARPMPGDSSTAFRTDPAFPLGPLPGDPRLTVPSRGTAAAPVRRIEIVPSAPAQPVAAPVAVAPPSVAPPSAELEAAWRSVEAPATRAPQPAAGRREARAAAAPPGPARPPEPVGPEATRRPAAPPPAVAVGVPPPVILVEPQPPSLQPLGGGSGVWYYHDQGTERGRR